MFSILRIAIDGFKRWFACLLLIILTLILFTGCQTAEQRKEDLLQTEATLLKQRDKFCYQNIKSKYEKDKDVLSYMEPWLDSDTADDTKGFFDGGDKIPTDYEVKIIIGIYNDVAYCRAQLIEGLTRIAPNMVPIYVQAYRASDLNIAELIEHKISWGEARERKLSLDNETERKIREEALRLEKDFEMSRYNDPANRRSDAQSESASLLLQSQQKVLENQQRQQQLLNTNDLHRTGSMDVRTY
jgi:hypothetical protein